MSSTVVKAHLKVVVATPEPCAVWRCYSCRAKLAEMELQLGRIAIKCYRCKAMNVREVG